MRADAPSGYPEPMAWLHAVLDLPRDLIPAGGSFWASALGWPVGPPWAGHPELRSFEPPEGEAYVHLQEIDGGARVHLDMEADDLDGTAERAIGLGARRIGRSERWQRLASPGGLPFCVLTARDRAAPQPVAWPGGHRSRMVQVAIDSPADVHEAEVAFWRALLGGRWVDSPAAEFAGKWHDDAGSPIQLLFQRLDDVTGAVRAHLDHGTDDQQAEVRRLLALGAQDVGGGPGGWHTLRDPAGLSFCVTGNSPDQLAHRPID